MGSLFFKNSSETQHASVSDEHPLPVVVGGDLQPPASAPDPTSTRVTIAAGASLSNAADLRGTSLVGVVTDAAWDAAPVSFAVSMDGNTFFPLRYQSAEFSEANPGASAYVALNPAVFAGVRYVKVRSGTSASAVNQADATVVTLICRPV